MNHNRKKIYSILMNLNIISNEDEINEQSNLRRDFALDSLMLVQFVLEIEKEFNIQFSDDELLFENFDSIEKTIKLVEEKSYE